MLDHYDETDCFTVAGIDPFAHTADDALEEFAAADLRFSESEGGFSATCIDPVIGLWRSGKRHDVSRDLPSHFASMLIALPGYYQ